MKVSKGQKVMSVNGEVGDVVEDFEGNLYLIIEVIDIAGIIEKNYRGLSLNNPRKKNYLYDCYLVANYGNVPLSINLGQLER